MSPHKTAGRKNIITAPGVTPTPPRAVAQIRNTIAPGPGTIIIRTTVITTTEVIILTAVVQPLPILLREAAAQALVQGRIQVQARAEEEVETNLKLI